MQNSNTHCRSLARTLMALVAPTFVASAANADWTTVAPQASLQKMPYELNGGVLSMDGQRVAVNVSQATVSPNKTMLAFATRNGSGQSDIFICSIPAQKCAPAVTVDAAPDAPYTLSAHNLAFSAQSRSLFFAAGTPGSTTIYRTQFPQSLVSPGPLPKVEAVTAGDQFSVVPVARGQFCAGDLNITREDGSHTIFEPNKKVAVTSVSGDDIGDFLKHTSLKACTPQP